MYITNTLMTHSHYGQSIRVDFICDTLYGKTLDDSAVNIIFPIKLILICGIKYSWLTRSF